MVSCYLSLSSTTRINDQKKNWDKMKHKPNFFIVGAAKSGTTAMDTYLRRHPEVYMAAKEPHYFANDLLEAGNPALDWDRYDRLFDGVGNEKIIGESSVFYLFSQGAAERIKAFSPDAKILIHIRNPVDVIPSHHSQVMYVGGEPLSDIREALAAESDRAQGINMPENFEWKKTLLYLDFVKFSDQIKRFQKYFGPEQIKINIFDDLKQDTRQVFQDTCRFLAIDPDIDVGFEVINANESMRSKRLMDSLVRNPSPWVSSVAKALFPLSIRNKIKNNIQKLNTSNEKRGALPEDIVQGLKVKLRPEIDKLSELLNRDLSHWHKI